MRLKNSRKIALTAVCTAAAFLCVLIGRFVPVGWMFLLVVSGTMTMLCVRMCGFAYGVLCYIATSLLSIAVLPFGFVYIVFVGIHALARQFLFGTPPRKPWRYAVAYPVLIGFAYGISIALVYLVGELAGVMQFVEAVGGIYVFAAIAAAIVLVYDLAVAYLSGALGRLITKKGKGNAAPKTIDRTGEPFAEYSTKEEETDRSDRAEPPDSVTPDPNSTDAPFGEEEPKASPEDPAEKK